MLQIAITFIQNITKNMARRPLIQGFTKKIHTLIINKKTSPSLSHLKGTLFYYTYSSDGFDAFVSRKEDGTRPLTESGNSAMSLKTPAKLSKFGPQLSR